MYLICIFLTRFIYSIHLIQVFSFVCVLTWSLLGVKKSLGHAQIGLPLWFNSKFPMSIPFQMRSPPPPPHPEWRTSTGNEAFSPFTCLGTNKFVLLTFFSLIKKIYPRVSTKPLLNDAKSQLPVDVHRSKTLLQKLPILWHTEYSTCCFSRTQLFSDSSFSDTTLMIYKEEKFIFSSDCWLLLCN